MKHISVLSFIILVFILSCGTSPTGYDSDDKPNVTQESFGEATLGDRTRTITTEISQKITDISYDGTVFTFEGGDLFLSKILKGDILIFDRSPKLPFGALRKVTRIDFLQINDVSRYTITTEDATFEDAFENLEISTSRFELNPANVDSIVYFVESTGMRNKLDLQKHLSESEKSTFVTSLDIYLLGNPQNPQNSVRINGSMSFTSNFIFEMEMQRFQIRNIVFENENPIQLQLELFAGLQDTLKIVDRIITAYYFAPIIIPVGPVPIILTPVLEVPLNVSGYISANFRPSISYQIETNAALRYSSGNWNNEFGFNHSFNGQMPIPQVSSSVKTDIGLKLNLKLYNAIGPITTFSTYAEGVYTPFNDPQINVYAGAKLDIGMEMKILSRVIANANVNLINYRSLIYSFSIGLPELSTRPITNITATTAQSGGIFESQGSQNVILKGVCWSTSPMPDINNNCSNNGSGTSNFTSILSALQPQTQYYVRAYAKTNQEVIYGNQHIFVTSSAQNNGRVSGQVRDAISNAPIQTVDIRVRSSSGTLLASGISDNGGNYNLSVAAGQDYVVEFSKNGYLPASYNNVNVEPNTTTFLSQLLYINEEFSGLGTISGRIINALTGNGVSGLNIALRENINNTTGTIIRQTTSSSNGSYQFNNINAGYYTITVSGTGYNATYFNVISLGGLNTDGQNGTVTPELPGDEYRIVLTWGVNPRDLDAHLTGPNPNGGRFHVFWSNRTFSHNGQVYARLDRDVMNSFGPETTTIYHQTSGLYRYSVHDYTNRNSTTSSALSQSNAQVRLYKGSNLINTFSVPTNQPGTLWTVFELNGSSVIPVNSMSFVSNSGSVQSLLNQNDADQIRSASNKPKKEE